MSIKLNEGVASILFGIHDENLRAIEDALHVRVSARGNEVFIQGEPDAVASARRLIVGMQSLIDQGFPLTKSDIATGVRVLKEVPDTDLIAFFADESLGASLRKIVTPRGVAQKLYLQAVQDYDITFAIGPAGTGKTFLAVAVAVAALADRSIKRIVLCRPAVEAGEKLGFLPGDLAEKINPYLRPLYDALYDLAGPERVSKLMERNVIEIAPLAFMRGRTLNDSFIILDEAQNTTPEQMKMFLTRLGFGSKAVITGDITQVDLPEGKRSGLRDARETLAGTEGLCFFEFTDRDVVRHPLVGRIVTAYDRRDRQNGSGSRSDESKSGG